MLNVKNLPEPKCKLEGAFSIEEFLATAARYDKEKRLAQLESIRIEHGFDSNDDLADFCVHVLRLFKSVDMFTKSINVLCKNK